VLCKEKRADKIRILKITEFVVGEREDWCKTCRKKVVFLR